jgi:hypothetical protein
MSRVDRFFPKIEKLGELHKCDGKMTELIIIILKMKANENKNT